MIEYKNTQTVINGKKSPLIKRNVPHLVINKEEELIGDKAIKIESINNSTITYNGIVYDAEDVSISRMSSVTALANAKFNKALVDGTAIGDAYAYIYNGINLSWVDANNVTQIVNVEDIVNMLELSLESLSDKIV